ncbi:MAG TPA: hypothetical protein VF811_06660 [Parasulfuritortus sp.]
MSWKYAWRYRWKVFTETLATPTFWWTVVGISGALVVWFYLFHMAIRLLDSSLVLRSTFCASDAQRDRHILVIVLVTPLFLVGMLGVIGEWMAIMDNRKLRRKNRFKALGVFSALMILSSLAILLALQC